MAETPTAWVINRGRDRRRWARFVARDWRGVDLRRFAAIDGHAPDFDLAGVPGLPRGGMWGEGWIKPGAVGCFLSHAAVWARVAAAGRPALVLEDDAVPAGGFAGAVMALGDRDILFINARTATWVPPGALGAVALTRCARHRLGRGWSGEAHPGTDGYLVSPAGARRLLALRDRLGLPVGVDWFIVGAATDFARLDPARIAADRFFAHLAHVFAGGPFVEAGILASPAVRLARHQPASALDHDAKVWV